MSGSDSEADRELGVNLAAMKITLKVRDAAPDWRFVAD